jgi:hypothetical protein
MLMTPVRIRIRVNGGSWWRRRRSVWEKLAGKNEMSEAAEMMIVVREILSMELDFKNVRYE